MVIKKIKLTNYRNHISFKTEFSQKTNLIIGPNGSGKTNILEAIHLLATTKAYKARFDKEVINHNETFAKIEIEVDDNDLDVTIISDPRYENMSHKKVKVNKVSKSLGGFSPYLYTVLFSPEEIEILRGSPGSRRHYMDMVLFQVDSEYKRDLSEYIKAVRQRNKVLEMINKTGRGHDQMGFWDEKVIQKGADVQRKREQLFDFLKTRVYAKGKEINDGTEILLKYKKNEITENRLGLYREREIAAKATLIGPHRDDFEVVADGYDLASFGSRGQQRTAILALKLSEIDFVAEVTSQRPILLLDDIFSELDEHHRDTVLETLGQQQTIITSTEDIPYLGEYKKIVLK